MSLHQTARLVWAAAWVRVLSDWTTRSVGANTSEERRRVTGRGERRWEPTQRSFDELRTTRTYSRQMVVFVEAHRMSTQVVGKAQNASPDGDELLHGNADYYSMYSTFLTASPGSVLFRRSNLLKRKDLCFSCLSLGLIRHRRSLRSSHLSSQVLHDSHRVTLEKLIF
jgi:hypothetical protein